MLENWTIGPDEVVGKGKLSECLRVYLCLDMSERKTCSSEKGILCI